MTGKSSLAIFGAKPRFSELLPVGQFYWPEWERYERGGTRYFFATILHVATLCRSAGGSISTPSAGVSWCQACHRDPQCHQRIDDCDPLAWTAWKSDCALLDVHRHCSVCWCGQMPTNRFATLIPNHSKCRLRRSGDSSKRRNQRNPRRSSLGRCLAGSRSRNAGREYGVALYYDAAHAFGCRVVKER